MRRTPSHPLQDGFRCFNNADYSRATLPHAGPAYPPRGYWMPHTPPPPSGLPRHYRSVYSEPPPPQGPAWYPGPGGHYNYKTMQMLITTPPPPPPPLPYYGPNVYTQFPHHPHPFRTHRGDIVVGKAQIQTTPTSDCSNGESTERFNPSESPVKHKQLSESTSGESSVTPKIRKRKSFRKNLVDKVQVQIKEENCKYTYNKSSEELHPEILATWRNNLNKSKEISSSTHKLKIEICLKKETVKQKLTGEDGKAGQEKSVSKPFKEREKEKSLQKKNIKQHHTKMSSSNSTDDEKSSHNGVPVSDSLPASSTRDKKHSTSEYESSALRFTPAQVHKIKKESKPKSSLKRSNYTPIIVEALEASISRENDVSPNESSSKKSRDRSSGSRRSNVQEPHRSTHLESDSSLVNHSSRDRSKSPRRSSHKSRDSSVSKRKSSSSASKPISPVRNSDHDSDCDGDRSQNSSIYVTPEGTPFSRRSTEAEERRNSRFKRSLSDEGLNESHSANSTFNSSGYFTPESSPSTINSAKRPKIRWSETSSFSQDQSSYSSWRHNTSCGSEQGVQPELIGYQMVGDSQFCRFGQQLLGLERVPMPGCPGRIGICISGQTITDLHKRVKDNFYPISDKIIVMIGTNDFLRSVDVRVMCEELSALVRTLQKSASNIILLTLPPIPKLEKRNPIHFKLLEAYNSHIRSLGNGESLRIADISPLYMTSPPHQRCRMYLFELYFGGQNRRFDMIHLNRSGLEIIRKYILDKFV